MEYTTKKEPKHSRFSQIPVTPFYYGWIILGVASLAHFTSAPGQTYVASIFLEPMVESMGWSRTVFSGLYTAGSLTAAIFMLAAGRALDLFGARIALSTLCLTLGMVAILMSGVDTEWKLYLGFAALRTIGQGSLGLVATTMISTWFVRMRGRAESLSAIGGAAGMAVFPFIVHTFIEDFGWRQTWRILGISVWTILLLPAVLLVRRSPEDVGLYPDGFEPDSYGTIDSKQETRVGENFKAALTETHFTLSEAIHTKSLWMLVFASTAMPLIMTGLMFHHVSILGAKGLSSGLAAGTMSLFGPLVLVANIGCGYLSDKVPNRLLLAAGQLGLVVAMLWLLTLDSPWQAILYVVLASLSVSLVMIPLTVIWANYFGRKHLGTIRGFAFTVQIGFSAMGALPFGLVYDRTGSYDSAILLLLLLPISACVFSILALPPKKPELVFRI